MTSYTRQLLSGSTNGMPVPVAATSIGSGTTLHTALAGTLGFDEVYLWASNIDSVDHTLTISWGSYSDPAGLICKNVTIQANTGPTPLVTGEVLQNGLVVAAAASVANVINITGFVNRIQ